MKGRITFAAEVWLNHAKATRTYIPMWHGYRPAAAQLRLAHSFDVVPVDFAGDFAESAHAACELVFAVCNVDPDMLSDGLAQMAAAYRAGRNRSLSVGDVVRLRTPEGDWLAFACERFGFRKIIDPRARR